MQGLTQKQIRIVNNAVLGEGITYAHLGVELSDHICCLIESEMHGGISFDEAFTKIMKEIGPQTLQKVQQDTILLIDKKYRLMKNSMKIIGFAAIALMVLGTLMKLQHLMGASIMLVLGFFLLGAFFVPSALWVMKKESKFRGGLALYIISAIGSMMFVFGILAKLMMWPLAGILLTLGFLITASVLIPSVMVALMQNNNTRGFHGIYITGGVAMIYYLIGILFKIMHWPGAAVMLIIGALMLTAVFFPLYAFKVYLKKQILKPAFIFLCTGILLFNMFGLLLAINVSKDYNALYERSLQDVLRNVHIYKDHNRNLSDALVSGGNHTQKLEQALSNSQHQQEEMLFDVLHHSYGLCSFIDSIKIRIISHADGIAFEEARIAAENPSLIRRKGDCDVSTYLLCGNKNDCADGLAQTLLEKIKLFKEVLLIHCPENSRPGKRIEQLLNTKSENESSGIAEMWAVETFHYKPLIAVIAQLSMIQWRVELAAHEVLTSMNNKGIINQ